MSKSQTLIRGFKGFRDASPFTIEENASPLCQDIEFSPRGTLKTPKGSTKWNTTSLGFINGLFDYSSRRLGRFIIDLYSTSGAGYPGVNSGAPVVSGTIDTSGTVISNTYSSPPGGKSTIVLTTTGTIYNRYGFPYVTGYTLTATVLNWDGSASTWSGTLTVAYSQGTGGTTTITVTNGTGSVTNTFYKASAADVPFTITASSPVMDDSAITRTAYYVYGDYSVPTTCVHGQTGMTFSVQVKSSLGNYDYDSGYAINQDGWATGFISVSGTTTMTNGLAQKTDIAEILGTGVKSVWANFSTGDKILDISGTYPQITVT